MNWPLICIATLIILSTLCGFLVVYLTGSPKSLTKAVKKVLRFYVVILICLLLSWFVGFDFAEYAPKVWN